MQLITRSRQCLKLPFIFRTTTYQNVVLHFKHTVRFALHDSALTIAEQSAPGHH